MFNKRPDVAFEFVRQSGQTVGLYELAVGILSALARIVTGSRSD